MCFRLEVRVGGQGWRFREKNYNVPCFRVTEGGGSGPGISSSPKRFVWSHSTYRPESYQLYGWLQLTYTRTQSTCILSFNVPVPPCPKPSKAGCG